MKQNTFTQNQEKLRRFSLNLRKLELELATSYFMVKETNLEEELRKIKLVINFALYTLTDDEIQIINTEFFMDRPAKEWWIHYFSRATYYRVKGRAMAKFLDCIDNGKMILY